MLKQWLDAGARNEPVWLNDVREGCAAMPDAARAVLQLTVPNGGRRDYPLPIPRWSTVEERDFVLEYVRACVFNLLSVPGGQRLAFYFDQADGALSALLREVPQVFQVNDRKRDGYGKVINIADRICRTFGAQPFQFMFLSMDAYIPAPPAERPAPSLTRRLLQAAERCETGLYCGVDIGGTDIKLVLARDGLLAEIKEYDWNPALSPTAEGIIGPIRALIQEAVDESAPGRLLDGLGISFPDVVIGGRVVGGETPKTQGMRLHASDYEAEFAEITALADHLAPLCAPGAPVRVTNDGHMAAFTAAMELSGRGGEVKHGVIAHSLGTDLGTGWLDADGSIPEAPMELYDLLLDLGSRPSRALPAEDLRGARNENSGLPDVRRCLGQAAAYRLAWQADPALLDGFTVWDGGILRIKTSPDLRKPCLAHLMEQAGAGNPGARSVFRAIGENLGQVCRELDWLLQPQTDVRFLFGRFVKEPVCFSLLREGCTAAVPGVRLEAMDGTLACTPLMRELSRRPGWSVAQFAQAVGAVYFSVMEEPSDETK